MAGPLFDDDFMNDMIMNPDLYGMEDEDKTKDVDDEDEVNDFDDEEYGDWFVMIAICKRDN